MNNEKSLIQVSQAPLGSIRSTRSSSSTRRMYGYNASRTAFRDKGYRLVLLVFLATP